jgi:hypothetical protein
MAMAAADDGAERQTCQGFFNVNGRGQDAFIHAVRFATSDYCFSSYSRQFLAIPLHSAKGTDAVEEYICMHLLKKKY